MRDLGHRAFIGFLWASASYAGGRILVFIATLVLARLLVPAEFGLVAFALAVIHYLEYLTDLGLGAALVYRSDAEDPKVSSTAFWIGIAGGLVLFAASWFLAPLLGDIGPDERVVDLFRVLSLYFLFTALGKAHEYRLRRSLEFRKLFWPQFLSGLTKGVVSIALAVAGAGAWSLIIGQLAGALCQSAALWVVHPWRPSFTISRGHLRPMLRFGLGIVAVGLLGQGASNFDYLIVGAKLGAVALGIYYLAFRLPELVILSGFQVANDVLFPFYARLREGEVEGADELRRGYLETVRLGSMVAFPAAFAMAALALPLVLTLYGEEWRAAAEPLAFVAIWAGLASLASMPGAVFKALGRSWLLAATGIMQIAILFPVVWVAADYSITAVAAAQVAEKTVSLALLGVIIGRILGIPWYSTFTAGAPALALSAVMAAILYPLTTTLPPAAALGIGIPLAALVYLALLRRFIPDGFRKLARPLRRAVVVGGVLALAVVAVGCNARHASSERRAPEARTPGPAFFVAPDGSDSSPGTRARPFGTLAHGLNKLRAGDHLYVRGGTYLARVKVNVAPGRPKARVLVTNFPGERPVVKGQLWIGNPSYWTIRGINVTWAKGNPDEPMTRVYGGTGWKLTGAEIWGAHSTSGLHIDDGPRNDLGSWAVTDNCIHDTYPTNGEHQDHNVYVDDMSASPNPHGVISRNVMFDAVNGRGIKLGPGGTTGGAENVTVAYNTIFNSAQNVGVSRDSSGVRIYRNLFVKAKEANVLGFELEGHRNLLRDNIGAEAPAFLANTGGRRPLDDGGGNLHAGKIAFDSIGCSGFHAGLGGYGAYG